MITVMGATGHTGGEISTLLLEAGEEVRALGRSDAKLEQLEHAGAQPLAGDATDRDFLNEAFDGAEAVYTLLPYNPYAPGYRASQDRLGEAIVSAVRSARVRYVVALSSVGADEPSGTGFVASLHAQEQRLRGLEDVNVLVLRPGSFFENFHAALDLIEHEGINADSVSPDVTMPMIATRDIAGVAAAALAGRDWQGVVVRELLGQRDLSYAEATRIIGAEIGKPDLEYVQLPYADMANSLIQMGFAEDFAGLHVELTRALNEGRVTARQARGSENTTATSFEDFAAELSLSLRV